MPRQVAEQVTAQIASHADEREACDPPGQPPQQRIAGDQRHQNKEGIPRRHRAVDVGQCINQALHAILRADRTSDCGEHRRQNRGMGERPLADIVPYEQNRAADSMG